MRYTTVLLVASALALPLACAPKPTKRSAKLASPEVNAGVALLNEGISACHEKHKLGGYAQLSMRIESSGRVSEVSFGKRFSGTKAGGCLRKLFIEQGRFEIAHGPMIVRYPLLVR